MESSLGVQLIVPSFIPSSFAPATAEANCDYWDSSHRLAVIRNGISIKPMACVSSKQTARVRPRGIDLGLLLFLKPAATRTSETRFLSKISSARHVSQSQNQNLFTCQRTFDGPNLQFHPQPTPFSPLQTPLAFRREHFWFKKSLCCPGSPGCDRTGCLTGSIRYSAGIHRCHHLFLDSTSIEAKP